MGTDEVRYIKMNDLWSKLQEKEDFKLVDVLGRDRFEKQHICGAINLPLEEIEGKATQMFSAGDTIVVYCASYDCPASTEAAKKLLRLGFTKVFDYKGGFKEWMDAGHPVYFPEKSLTCETGVS